MPEILSVIQIRIFLILHQQWFGAQNLYLPPVYQKACGYLQFV